MPSDARFELLLDGSKGRGKSATQVDLLQAVRRVGAKELGKVQGRLGCRLILTQNFTS